MMKIKTCRLLMMLAPTLLPALAVSGEAVPTETPPHAAHQIFNVAGGKDMDALKCTTPQRRKSPERRPTPSQGDNRKKDPAPAGSEEEIIPLSEEEEAAMLKKALAPPSSEELRRNLPKSEWIKKFHATLSATSRQRIARVGIWGGSHMAAEFFTTEFRQALQERYGVGGAGHVNLLYGRPGLNLPVSAFCRTGEWHEELPPRTVNSPKISSGLGLYAMTANSPHAALEIS
jgi:hypothetical protein